MASLANQTISSTYDGLVKTATDQPVGVSGVQLLEDGVGNSLALSVGRANQGVTVTGPLTGTLSATSVLADGVIATTQATSDNSTKVATTAYVKSVVTAEDLDIAGTTGTGSVDLDSQTLTIAGTANEIETSASGQTITIGLPSTITANVTGNVAGDLTGTVLTAAQANITSVGTLSSLAVSGNLTVDTDTLFVDAANNRVGIGTSSPSALLHINTSDTAGVSSLEVARFSMNQISNFGDGLYSSYFYNTSTEGARIGMDVSVVGGNLYFTTNGSEHMRILAGGNVGIGTSSPKGKFHIAAPTGVSGFGSIALAIRDSAATDFGFDFNLEGVASGDLSLMRTNSDVQSQVMTFSRSSGNVSFGANASFANGNGIDFSASAGGGATSSLLDDYEEGTWSPVYVPTTGTFATMTMDIVSPATYTKIGRMVTVFANIRTSNVDVTGGTGQVRIAGLPFTVSGTGGGIAIGLTLFFTTNPDAGVFINSGTEIELRKTNSTEIMLIADLSNGVNANHNIITLTGTYFI